MHDTKMDEPGSALTEFQIEVARLFFELPQSNGFLLAGGAALVAQNLVQRPTADLDFFTGVAERTRVARDALESAVRHRGWTVERIRDADSFCRLVVTGPEQVVIDIALDARASLAPTVTLVGPSFAPEELAARKLIALFDRAEARDFADVYVLASRFNKWLMLRLATAIDAGLEHRILADMMATLARFRDSEIPLDADEVPQLRAFFAEWRDELRRDDHSAAPPDASAADFSKQRNEP
ncbi:MAG: nucleotidyl transferase AbiEii/AbiGii toxin family protein [Candidatus Nanopelagicales bacterium]|nr:nucleotidyl transferase AbiEii/AbiGii toxin family protein [Candidatus Nanopelagicales bacterium]